MKLGIVAANCFGKSPKNFFFLRKLMSLYEDISSQFEKVSQFFKYGNLRLFQKDMAHYLTDLQFTKGLKLAM